MKNYSLFFRYHLLQLTLSLIALAIASSCGVERASSSDTHAESIPAPLAGYHCFAVISEGKAVGGNCLKE